MNRAQRRAKEKEARRRNKGVHMVGVDPAQPGMDHAVTWVADQRYRKPKEEPKERKIPGINCKPIDPEFVERVNLNLWHDRSELDQFIETIKAQSVEDNYDWCWAYNHSCKYVDIRVDMRDGGFIVMDKDGRRIDLATLKWQYKSIEDTKG